LRCRIPALATTDSQDREGKTLMEAFRSQALSIAAVTAGAALLFALLPGEAQAQSTLSLEFSEASVKDLSERTRRGIAMQDLGPWIAENARISTPRGMERGRLSVIVVDASGRVLGEEAHRFEPEEEELQMIPVRDLGTSLGRLVPGGRMIQPEGGGDDLFVPARDLIAAGDLGTSLGRLVPGGRMIQPEGGGDDLFVPARDLIAAGSTIRSPAEGARVASQAGVRAIRASGDAKNHAVILLLTPDEDRFRTPIAPVFWVLVGGAGTE